NERHGIIIIAPTGTGKSTSVYGLTAAKPGNRLHSDDWAFVNVGTLETVASEDQYYMRTNIAEIFPHYIPVLVNQPLENVPFTPDIIALIERYPNPEAFAAALKNGEVTQAEFDTLVAQMIKNNAARSLIDPRLMVGVEKFTEVTTLQTILLMKRDFLDTLILKRLTADEMLEIMTSEGNVFNHVYGQADPDGYGIPQPPTTEIYYNPYLCQVLVERKTNRIGPLDQKRIAAYRALAEHPQVRTAWVNTRLPARQTQFCLRKFLDGQCDGIRLVKGVDIPLDLVKRLGVTTKEKPMVPGRRPMDRVGIYKDGVEVEVATFEQQGDPRMSVAFDKTGKGLGQVKAYSEGTVEDFFKHHESLFVRELFQS
ncbi:MAG: hypothetical protein HYZ73_02100, partial [Elusimicrobia bacterium]|nr:hypothetical protein [Elusimicrobiota bacterium]